MWTQTIFLMNKNKSINKQLQKNISEHFNFPLVLHGFNVYIYFIETGNFGSITKGLHCFLLANKLIICEFCFFRVKRTFKIFHWNSESNSTEKT